MSESPQVAASCHTPPNRWQIPLLGLGVLLLAAGITRLLRSLLNKWTVRDGLWGEANRLLGRLQQLDGRPQAGLSFHAEVLRCFTAGERESGTDEDPAGRS